MSPFAIRRHAGFSALLFLLGFLPLGALFVSACDGSSTGPGADEGQAEVTVLFGTPDGASETAARPATAPGRPSLTVEGTNGVLTLEDVRLVVDELELEGTEGACEAPDEDDEEECADFEFPRFFLDLPLDGGAVAVDTEPVPLGTYEELEFEVEDIDFDEEDEDESEVSELADQIRDEFPDWPSEASLLVVGTFTPDGGEAVAFRTYFEAEVEVETELDPHLVIDETGASRTVTVQVRPNLWFLRGDGTVVDLSALDFERTGEVVELEAEIENASWEVEFDD